MYCNHYEDVERGIIQSDDMYCQEMANLTYGQLMKRRNESSIANVSVSISHQRGYSWRQSWRNGVWQ